MYLKLPGISVRKKIQLLFVWCKQLPFLFLEMFVTCLWMDLTVCRYDMPRMFLRLVCYVLHSDIHATVLCVGE